MLITGFADSSGHWYTRAGDPAYRIVGKNGKERNTTLRDAREHDLVPSVTTIIRMMSNPGLEQWKQEQMMLACLTIPRIENEPEKDFLARVVADSRQQSKAAAERGERIHGALECAFRGEPFNLDDSPYVDGVRDALYDLCGHQEWHSERSFASPMGYAGKVDLHSRHWVIDFKTKEFSADKEASDLAYDEHVMQLSAYAEGLDVPNAANVFVSVSDPGLVKVKVWTADEMERGWEMFYACLQLWKLKNRFQ